MSDDELMRRARIMARTLGLDEREDAILELAKELEPQLHSVSFSADHGVFPPGTRVVDGSGRVWMIAEARSVRYEAKLVGREGYDD